MFLHAIEPPPYSNRIFSLLHLNDKINHIYIFFNKILLNFPPNYTSNTLNTNVTLNFQTKNADLNKNIMIMKLPLCQY